MKNRTENHPPASSRPYRRRRILARVCIAICVLNLAAQATLAVTVHHHVILGPAVPVVGLLAGLLFLASTRRS